MTITHRKVQSSNIESWGYDADARILEVRFKSATGTGKLFRYLNVPPEAAEGLAKAQSVGMYFAKGIRARYKGEAVAEVKPAAPIKAT